MDYEQKYNKLVEAVKVLQETNPSDEGIQNWVNDNVPELCESEYEKIRKEILEYFQQFENEELRGANISDWIAWLEKLKVFTEHGDVLYHFGNSEFTYVGNPTWDNVSFLEKQGETKEYTFKSIPRLLDMIEPSDRAKAYCQKLIDTLAKEGYNTDAKIVEGVLKGWNGEDVPMAVMDEKQGQKSAWSEEDEERFQSCLYILQAKGFMGVTETINTKWLKSLKQRYIWKPSKEQMDAMQMAVSYFGYNWVSKKQKLLESLYKDLKKL